MNSSTLKEPKALITERVCRVTLDCTVRVGDITPEMLRKSIYWDERDQESAHRRVEWQRLLLRALLRDDHALEQFLVYVVVTDFGVLLGTSPGVTFPVEDEDAILEGVRLCADGGDDSSAGVVPAGRNSFDDTELFHACFTVDWSGAVVRAVGVMPGGSQEVASE